MARSLRDCPACRGKCMCQQCGGSGKLRSFIEASRKCGLCNGTGKCPRCRGKGEVLAESLNDSFIGAIFAPPVIIRPLPKWFDDLGTKDSVLAEVLKEVYAALQNNLLIVATAGTRILLDRAMVLLLREDSGGFGKKLNNLTDQGIIGQEDRELLSVMTEAGHAASHRGYRPSLDTLVTILDTIENLLHRKFILQPAATGIRNQTPVRERSPNTTVAPSSTSK